MVGFIENGLETCMKPSDVVETRRIPVHGPILYPEALKIKDLRAVDRVSMFAFWTFTTADHLDVRYESVAVQPSEVDSQLW